MSLSAAGDALRCRPVLAGSKPVLVETTERDVLARVDDLLAGLPTAAEAAGGVAMPPSRVRIDVVQEHRAGAVGALYALSIDHEVALDFGYLWDCEDALLTRVNEWALDSEPERLHMHAGLVERAGVGALLVGTKGVGKSTLTAHLVRSGWIYHTDEMVGFAPDEPLVAHSFARPLTLKRGSWPLFPDLPSIPRGDRAERFQERVHFPPDEVGAVTTGLRTQLAAVIFLGRGIGPVDTLVPVGAGEAVERLVAETFDLGRLGNPGLDILVALATRTQLFALNVGDLDRAAGLLDDVASSGRPEPRSATRLEPVARSDRTHAREDNGALASDEIGPLTHVVPAAGVVSWAVPDGGLLYRARDGLLARLDSRGIGFWRRLDGRHSISSLVRLLQGFDPPDDGVVRDTVELVRELHRLGFVETIPDAAAGSNS
jgi:hypothetical protein